MRSMAKTSKIPAEVVTGLQLKEELRVMNRLEAATILKELTAGFKPSLYAEPVEEYLEGFVLNFPTEEEELRFEDKLLETALPIRAAHGNFRELCWQYFQEQHIGWQQSDYEASSAAVWSGGGFYMLPTVEYMVGGTVLWITESQVDYLRKFPWVSATPDSQRELYYYVSVSVADELVVVPDDMISSFVD